MSAINWNGGQRISLCSGKTATCTTLQAGQIYCLFFYNESNADHNIPVDVTWSNAHPPQRIMVPGTTAKEGLASLVLVSGDDTGTVSVSVPTGTISSCVDTWIGSVQMPTDTSGLNNKMLPATGQPQSFDKYSRYYAVPASHWYSLTLYSPVNQFFAAQFQESLATIFVLNPGPNPEAHVTPVGSVKRGKDYKVVMPSGQPNFIQDQIFGDGTQWVWMPVDSAQNSNSSSITLQSMSSFAVEECD